MRHIWIFLLALGLGALTVSGQDDDDAALREKIEQVTAELEKRAEARKAPVAQRVVLETYDVADLCSPVRDEVMAATNLRPSRYEPPDAEEEGEARPYEIDMIIELVRQTVAPSTWDTIEGADMMPKGSRLLVATIPDVHARIAALLKRLRAYLDAQIAVDIVAVPVATHELGGFPRELSDALARDLLAMPPLGSVRVVCFDGQQVVQRAGAVRTYLADYDVSVSEGAAIGDPVRAEVFSGCAVEVRSMLDRGGQGVVLHLRAERTRVHDPVRQVRTTHGALDLPTLDLTRLETALWAPLGRTIVAGGGTIGNDSCVFLVTAKKVTAK